ncbi:MAG: DUF1365 domain-containing protein [Gemmatimonadetes bacterium]|nr:DUF1365 domain-containing protein [Gemmatimonadota bacterium]
MKSALYRGTVRHRRRGPVAHALQVELFMLYMDLAELPQLFDGRWLWSARRAAPAWFRRADYLGDAAVPLDAAVRDLVEARTGRRPDGPIHLLTHLRYWGFVMNPVSFYYCFDAAGARVETIVADITNTPWKERFAYVLDASRAEHQSVGGTQRFRFDKQFHVSPFLPMDHQYVWHFSPPGDRLLVHMQNLQHGAKEFDATLALRREPITGPSLARALALHPWMTATVGLSIYWNAFRLWLKRTPYVPHPSTHDSHALS